MNRIVSILGTILVLTATSWAGDGVWTTTGPDGGTVQDLAFDPSTPDVVYAGTVNGVFKSTDAGDSWLQLRGNEPNRLPWVRVTGVAASPDGKLYVGTHNSGFFLSEDGGESWFPGNTGIEGKRYLTSILIDPNPPYSTLFLVSRGGVNGRGPLFRSDDAGQGWYEAHGTPPTLPMAAVDLAFHRGMLYAATTEGVFKSPDGGDSWDAVNGVWPNTLQDAYPREIAASGDDVLYVATGDEGVYRSFDGGDTWQRANGTFPNHFPYDYLGRFWITTLGVDGHENLYVGGRDAIYRGVNGGQTWSQAALPYVPTQVYAAAGDPEVSDRVFAAASPGGVIRSLDSGESWTEVKTGLRAAAVTRIHNDPATPANSFTTYTLAKTPDAGASWEEFAQGLPNARNQGVAICPGDGTDSPTRYYAVDDAWLAGVYGRDDGDAAWTPLTPPDEFEDGARLTAVAVDPTDRDHLFVGQLGFPAWVVFGDAPGGLFRSTDGGNNWTAVYSPPSPQYPDPDGIDIYQPNAIVVDPRDPQRVYATAIWIKSDYVTWGWHVLRSTDGGADWQEVASGESTDSQFRYPVLDANDPADVGDASTIYVYDANEEATLRSRDGGDTWSLVGGSWLTVHPELGGVLFAGFPDNVVRMSEDRGETWTPLPMNGFDNQILGIGMAATSPPVILLGSWGGVYAYTLIPDEDGDGVPDDEDACPGTVIPEEVPFFRLGVNRWALVDDDTVFDTVAPPGGGPELSFTIEDTAGCSCEQIIEARGLGHGHRRLGCSTGVMQSWDPPSSGGADRTPVVVIRTEDESSVDPRSRRVRGTDRSRRKYGR
jgi:photosystem II stability/assembly factor-like uncharacterized protein